GRAEMPDLAWGGKGGGLGASGSPAGDARLSWASSEPSASRPKPLPARKRNSRREEEVGGGGGKKRIKGEGKSTQKKTIQDIPTRPKTTNAHAVAPRVSM